jgi:hypothetical protein
MVSFIGVSDMYGAEVNIIKDGQVTLIIHQHRKVYTFSITFRITSIVACFKPMGTSHAYVQ